MAEFDFVEKENLWLSFWNKILSVSQEEVCIDWQKLRHAFTVI